MFLSEAAGTASSSGAAGTASSSPHVPPRGPTTAAGVLGGLQPLLQYVRSREEACPRPARVRTLRAAL